VSWGFIIPELKRDVLLFPDSCCDLLVEVYLGEAIVGERWSKDKRNE